MSNIEPSLLPVVKDILQKRAMWAQKRDYAVTSLIYKRLKTNKLTIDQVGQLLLELDYMSSSQVLIAGTARLFVELLDENEVDPGIFDGNDSITREINRYYYLMHDKYVEGWPRGEVWLQDLFKFKKINIEKILKGYTLRSERQSLSYACPLSWLTKYGIVSADLTIVNLRDNQLTSLPSELVSTCPKLHELALCNNRLTVVPCKLVSRCPMLEK